MNIRFKLLGLCLSLLFSAAEGMHIFTTDVKENQRLTANIIEKVLDQNYFALDHITFNCSVNGEPKSCLVQFARMQLARKNNSRAFSQYLRDQKTVLECVRRDIVTLTCLEEKRFLLKIKDYKAKKNELILQISFHKPLPDSQSSLASLTIQEPALRTTPLPSNFGLSLCIPADPNISKVIATVMHLVERIDAQKDKWEVLVKLNNPQQKTLLEGIFRTKGLEHFRIVEDFNPQYSLMAICQPGVGHLIDPVTPTLEAFEKYENISVTGHCHRPMAFGESLEIIEDHSQSTHVSGWLAFKASLYAKESNFGNDFFTKIIQMTTLYASPTILYVENYKD